MSRKPPDFDLWTDVASTVKPLRGQNRCTVHGSPCDETIRSRPSASRVPSDVECT